MHLTTGANLNTIGGDSAAERNIISGHGGVGVLLFDADDNSVVGNYIGTDWTGRFGLGTAQDGIQIYAGSQDNTIGGPAEERNVISGNGGEGIAVDSTGTRNTLLDNLVGTKATGIGTIAGQATSLDVIDSAVIVDGTVTARGDVTVAANGMLGGVGTIIADVTNHGTLAPGNSPGILTVAGDFEFADNSTFLVEIGGTTPGSADTEHDQLDVNGGVTIGANVTLNTSSFNGYVPTAGDAITIIDNDGTDAIGGAFDGLAEGSTLPNFLGSGLGATISYAGGDGNDVVLAVGPASYDFTAATYSAAEGDATNTTAVVTVTRSGTLAVASSVQVNLAAGTLAGATAGSDFTAGPVTVNFGNGQTTQTVAIELLGDKVVERDETIALTLINPSGIGSVGTTQPTATLTITEDDAAEINVSSTVSPGDDMAGEAGETGLLTFTLVDPADGNAPVTIDQNVDVTFRVPLTGDLTADDFKLTYQGLDLTADTGTAGELRFTIKLNAGTQSGAVTVTALDNVNGLGQQIAEGLETITADLLELELSDIGGGDAATLGYTFSVDTADANVVIADDEFETIVQVLNNQLILTDVAGSNTADNWTITADGTNLTITDNNSNLIDIVGTITGATGDETASVTVPLSAFSGKFKIDSLGGNDTLTFGTVTLLSGQSLEFNGGSGGDTALVTGPISTSGIGAVSLNVSHNIAMTSGSSITTVNGNITLIANQAATATADFIGIDLDNATVTSTNGAITLDGTGSGTLVNTPGVNLNNGAVIQSTGVGGAVRGISITGTGAASTGSAGIMAEGPTTLVTAVDGDINIMGSATGGSGVMFNGASWVTSTGTGTHAGTITITGHGQGIQSTVAQGVIFGPGTTANPIGGGITSIDGDILVTGTSAAAVSGGAGVMFIDSNVASTGVGPHAAKIALNGTSTSPNDAQGQGVYINGPQTFNSISSVDGDISITGSSTDSQGVVIWSSQVNSSGSGADAATITIEGTGTLDGVRIQTGTDLINSIDGDISITGTGLDVAADGIELSSTSSRAIRATGAANVTLSGNAEIAGQFGIRIESPINNPADGGSGELTLMADTLSIADTVTAAAITVTPVTAGTTIDLGGADVFATTLGLTDAELDLLTAASLTIGDSSSGDVTITAPITPAGVGTVNLFSAGDIGDSNTSTGDFTGTALVASGNVSPGQSPGILSVNGDFAFADDSSFTVQIGGTTPGTANNQHDQLDADNGDVIIGENVTLHLSAFDGYLPTAGDTITIIDNEGGDAISGEFAGLPEGATIENFFSSGRIAVITYQGGDGNDLQLLVGEVFTVINTNDAGVGSLAQRSSAPTTRRVPTGSSLISPLRPAAPGRTRSLQPPRCRRSPTL